MAKSNRLKTWSTSTGDILNTFTDGDHLDNKYTAIAAVAPAGGGKKNKGKKNKGACLVALGTDSGAVVVWRTDLGEVAHRLAGASGHSAKVTSLCFNREGTLLYSGGEDGNILEWSLADGTLASKMSVDGGAVSCLCLEQGGSRLLSATASIQLWDLSTHKVSRKYVGHTSAVTCLALSNDGSFFVSGANDRFVSLWATQSTKKK